MEDDLFGRCGDLRTMIGAECFTTSINLIASYEDGLRLTFSLFTICNRKTKSSTIWIFFVQHIKMNWNRFAAMWNVKLNGKKIDNYSVAWMQNEWFHVHNWNSMESKKHVLNRVASSTFINCFHAWFQWFFFFVFVRSFKRWRLCVSFSFIRSHSFNVF